MFWEQYEVSIHFKTHLTNVEKLACLGHAPKDGPAIQAMEGLSRSAVQYGKEAMARICTANTMLLANIYKHLRP